jgi:hypothetical protein
VRGTCCHLLSLELRAGHGCEQLSACVESAIRPWWEALPAGSRVSTWLGLADEQHLSALGNPDPGRAVTGECE